MSASHRATPGAEPPRPASRGPGRRDGLLPAAPYSASRTWSRRASSPSSATPSAASPPRTSRQRRSRSSAIAVPVGRRPRAEEQGQYRGGPGGEGPVDPGGRSRGRVAAGGLPDPPGDRAALPRRERRERAADQRQDVVERRVGDAGEPAVDEVEEAAIVDQHGAAA